MLPDQNADLPTIHGCGAIKQQPIPKGTIIGEYVGEVMDNESLIELNTELAEERGEGVSVISW
jgi:SET domain-containing protein